MYLQPENLRMETSCCNIEESLSQPRKEKGVKRSTLQNKEVSSIFSSGKELPTGELSQKIKTLNNVATQFKQTKTIMFMFGTVCLIM